MPNNQFKSQGEITKKKERRQQSSQYKEAYNNTHRKTRLHSELREDDVYIEWAFIR